jgi:hypothetical protein
MEPPEPAKTRSCDACGLPIPNTFLEKYPNTRFCEYCSEPGNRGRFKSFREWEEELGFSLKDPPPWT